MVKITNSEIYLVRRKIGLFETFLHEEYGTPDITKDLVVFAPNNFLAGYYKNSGSEVITYDGETLFEVNPNVLAKFEKKLDKNGGDVVSTRALPTRHIGVILEILLKNMPRIKSSEQSRMDILEEMKFLASLFPLPKK